MRYFTLKTIDSITPGCGEELGDLLAKSADAELEKIEQSEYDHSYGIINAAQLLYLAADAYRAGAGASIGRSRSMRYYEAADNAIYQADKLYEKAKAKINERKVTV